MRSERLRYEPLDVHHAAALFAALDDQRVGEHIGGPDVTSVEATRQRIERLRAGPPPGVPDEHWINHAVIAELPGAPATLIGRVEATTYGAWAEIAYVFGPAYWGRGYATEATAWLLDHLRDEHGIDECWAAVHPANDRSIRLLERLGFERLDAPGRPLGSYDEGDLVFARRMPSGTRATL